MSGENNKHIKVKMRVVAFSDLPKVKEVSYKEVGVGNMRTKIAKEDKNKVSHEEELAREGNESII